MASSAIPARFAPALVANPDGFLVPGIFGSMRLSSRPPGNVLLVPDSAVITDQAGKAVMTIGKNGGRCRCR